jgi:hypothetical protein
VAELKALGADVVTTDARAREDISKDVALNQPDEERNIKLHF